MTKGGGGAVPLKPERVLEVSGRASMGNMVNRAEVTVLGDLSLRCGGRVEAHRPQWGLEGVYDITAHEHRWEKGVFTTSLSLEGVET